MTSTTNAITADTLEVTMENDPVVMLGPEATVRGIWKHVKGLTNTTKRVAAFLGIPFAEPPLGERRFAPPVPCSLWHGERKAQKFGSFCPQNIKSTRETYFPMYLEDNMSEDCLFINVWTPAEHITNLLPVMIWIQGGSYTQGCSNYFDGTALCGRHDVIHVSFNYRVGPFGFMCLNDDRIKGNMGMLDQIEALRWVQRHIEAFGGDRQNVTVFGESAGAVCISMLLTSPLVMGQGLIKRAIMQSGSCFTNSNCRPPEYIKGQILEKLKDMGADNISTGQEIADFLRDKSSSEILASLALSYAPVLDGVVVPKKCSVLYEAGQFEPVDVIVGFNSFEGAYFVRDYVASISELNTKTADDYLKRIVYQVYYRFNEKADEIYKEIYNEYLHGITDSDQLYRALVELCSDVALISPSVQSAITHSARAKSYLYQFDHRPFYSTHPEWITADHWDEIPYVFGEAFLGRMPEGSWSETDQNISTTLMKYWTNFATTSDPNGDGLLQWPVYNTTNREMLVIRSVSSVCSNYNPTRISFWLDRIHNIVKSEQESKL